MREAAGAIFNTDPVMPVDEQLVKLLKTRALAAPSGRFRLCLHHATTESVQQMIIAHRRANYSRPHRQQASKLYMMIEGELMILIFSDRGELSQRITIKSPGQDAPFCLRLAADCWHTTFAVSDVAVVCEVLGAPNPNGEATEHPDWAPEENDPAAIKAYLDTLNLSAEFA